MPGYILHLTAAKMALDMLQKTNEHFKDSKVQNDFLVGSLLPDAVNSNEEKNDSHFRNPVFHGNMVEYPDLDLFLEKYRKLLSDPSCLGYYFHLYIDRQFFKEYLPSIVAFSNKNGQSVEKKDEVVWVYIKGTKQKIPMKDFFSGRYYYGDYTKMNTYLVEKYRLPLNLNVCVENPGIEEVNYQNIQDVLQELKGYLGTPESAVEELKVFEIESLIDFLDWTTRCFVDKMLIN